MSTTTFGAVLGLSSQALFFEVIAEKADQRCSTFVATAVRTLHLAFFVIHERQNLVEEFIAVRAEEFVVGHRDLHNSEG